MVFHYQMKMVPDDFFEDVLASNNFLATTLSLLFANIEGLRTFFIKLINLNEILRCTPGKQRPPVTGHEVQGVVGKTIPKIIFTSK